MESQSIINAAFALCGAMGGWILNNLKSSIADLQQSDRKTKDKLHDVEVFVASHFVSRKEIRESFRELGDQIGERLDKIEKKIDRKADRKEHE